MSDVRAAAPIVLGIAGSIIGNLLLPGIGGAIGGLIGSAVGSILFPPKQQGPRLEDLRTLRSEYGQMIPWLRGVVRSAGHVIWQTDLVAHEGGGGGKGGGGGGSGETTYTISMAILLCEGPIDGIRRCWKNGKVIWSGGEPTAEFPFTLYRGTATQDPDPTMEADPDIGTGNVPDYRGYAYLVLKDAPCEGNRVDNYEFEIEVTGTAKIDRVGPEWSPQQDESYTSVGVSPLHSAYLDGDQIVQCCYLVNNPTTEETYQEFRYNLYTGALEDEQAISLTHGLAAATNMTFCPSHNSNVAVGKRQTSGSTDVSRWYIAGVLDEFDRIYPPQGVDEFYAINCKPWVQDGFVYGAGGNGYAYIGKWAVIDGDHIEGTPESEFFDVEANAASTFGGGIFQDCSLTMDDEGFLWACCLHSSSSAEIFKIDPSDMSLVHQWDVSGGAIGDDLAAIGSGMRSFTVFRDMIVLPAAGVLDAWRLYSINDDDTFTLLDDVTADVTAGGGYAAVSLGGGFVLGPDGVFFISSLDDLAAVNAAICEWGDNGLDSSRYNVTDLVGIPVRGFKLASVMSKHNAIEELRKRFPYGVAEVDGQAFFRLFNHDPDDEVADEDLAAATENQETPAPIKWELVNDLELPRRVTIRFTDCDNDYQVGSAYAICDSSIANAETVFDVAVVMTQTEANSLAQNYIARAFLERRRASFTLPRPYLAMTPLDVWTVDGYDIRIETTQWAAGDVLEVTGKLSHAGIYDIESIDSSSGTGSGGTGVPGTTRKKLSLTESVLLDIPQILGSDSLYGFDWAAGPKNSAERWPGAILYRSRDDGTTYEVAAKTTKAYIIGKALDVLGDHADPTTPDTVNTVQVQLTRTDATIDSITDDALSKGGGLFALWSVDKWELAQYRDATLISPQVYELSYFMRGVLDTDEAIPDHAVGDTFVILPVKNVDAPESDLNVPLLYKAVTMGADFDSAPWVEFTNTGNAADSGGGNIIKHLPVLFVFHDDDYTFLERDRGKWHIFDGSADITVTLPAGLKDGWNAWIENVGVNDVTLDPANNLDGLPTSLVLSSPQGVKIATDGTDYYTIRGATSGGSSGGGSIAIKDEGSTITAAASSVDFVGPGVTAVAVGSAVTVTVQGTIHTLDQGSDVDVDATVLNFNAPLSAADAGAGVTNVTHDDTAVTPGTYNNVTVNQKGHVTSASYSAASQTLSYCGTGEDGAADFDGSNTYGFASKSGNIYTLTRGIQLSSCIVRTGCELITANYQYHCSGNTDLAGTGAIHNDGIAATSFTGASERASAFYVGSGSVGANGTQTGAPSNSTGVTNSIGQPGGAGGSSPSGAGSSGGTCTVPAANNGGVAACVQLWNLYNQRTGAIATTDWLGGSGGGGGRGEAGNLGGGGGSPGGLCFVATATISGTGRISANGGAGFTPTVGTNVGGGGGGAGGVAVLITATPSHSVTVQANGGTPGNGRGTGTAGSTGGAGRVFQFLG